MSRHRSKRRRSTLAQREMMAIIAAEELRREQEESLARLQAQLDQIGNTNAMEVGTK
jgi:hypothetical protein